MNKEDKTKLKKEFQIHFKNSPDEFGFLEAFIDELLKAQREDLLKKIPKQYEDSKALEDIKKLI